MTSWVRRDVKGGVDGHGDAHDLQLLAPATEHDDPPRPGDHVRYPVDPGIVQPRSEPNSISYKLIILSPACVRVA